MTDILHAQVLQPSLPSAPSAGCKLYSSIIAGRNTPTALGSSGLPIRLQSALFGRTVAMWQPAGNSSGVPGVLGMQGVTVTGTATARNVATTNLFTRQKRLGFVSTTTAGTLAGPRIPVAQITTGITISSINTGGFFWACTFGTSDAATVSGARQFVGVSSSTSAPTNVQPSTLTNVIGVGHGNSDTNLFIYYGGSAAQTPINLGANFPANTLSVDTYTLYLFCAAGVNNSVGYLVERNNTTNVASGTLTGTAGTALPANTTLLTMLQAWRSNNATALAVGLDIFDFYCGIS